MKFFLQKSNKEGIQKYDEITNRNNHFVTNLVNSNQVDSSNVNFTLLESTWLELTRLVTK